MANIPSLKWAQRREKVFVTFECVDSKESSVELTTGLLSMQATDKNGKAFKLENMPLWEEIDPDGSKWFRNDRRAQPALHAWTPATLSVLARASASRWDRLQPWWQRCTLPAHRWSAAC